MIPHWSAHSPGMLTFRRECTFYIRSYLSNTAHTAPQEQGSSGMAAGGAKVGHLLQVGMRGGLTHDLTPQAWGRQNRWMDQLVHKLLFHSV